MLKPCNHVLTQGQEKKTGLQPKGKIMGRSNHGAAAGQHANVSLAGKIWAFTVKYHFCDWH